MASKPTARRKQAGPRPEVASTANPNASVLPAESGFRLRLGRTVWRLIGTEGTEGWLAEFARILELEPWRPGRGKGGRARKMIFWNTLKPASEATRNLLPWAGSAGPESCGWTGQWTNPVGIWTHPGSPDIVLQIRSLDNRLLAVENMVKSCYAFFPPIISEGGSVLHAALVEKNGRGVVLAASGGVGKSTCARRIPPPWKALCDDTCLVLPDGRGGFQVHPFATWSDYLWERSRGTWKVESPVPLQAVFFLKHSEEDNAQPLGQGESAIHLSRSSHELLAAFLESMDRDRARSFRQDIFDNACALSRKVTAYWLEVNLEGRFWTKIDKALDERLF